ncbi:aldolase catalytic domain-containing protein [Aquirhabdus parva]|uniref:Pyruvate carboxyltransferase domain-containing protein n=1 Tax=Aquirhabdus parva TaxID=2283318 RepID=A0A345P7D3_9GAMM|nr:aldolase catalytic domain-containing protein [Aquirhabdus parva]AXI03192.1 hypothetical protein HYN46_10295 [Aquirhabdus parva]
MSAGQLTLLDCTLRDGGYYNNWDFDLDLVERYLQSMVSSGVDIVELGFRFTFANKAKFLGPYAYTTDRFLNQIHVPEGLILGVMVNAADYLKAPEGDVAAIRNFFAPKVESKVQLVRIAAHVAEVATCGGLVSTLHELGYRVGFNIMQSNSCTDEKLAELVRAIRGFEHVEVLYFADSLGNMDDAETLRIIQTLRLEWDGPLGFHGHDNMGKALGNTMTALSNGVSWLDATVTGMGRGAGNTQMEYLLVEIEKNSHKSVNPAQVIDLACNDFEAMKKHYGWGMNVFYYLGAQHKVHPTYVQDMLAQGIFSPNDVVTLIDLLGENTGASYKSQGVANLMTARFQRAEGSWSSRQLFENRPVLIVAGGPSAHRHWTAIENYIQENKPIVISLNLLDFVPLNLLSAIAVCHPGRLVPLMNNSIGVPLITPIQSLPSTITNSLSSSTIYDYGMQVDPTRMVPQDTGCIVSDALVAPYAICAALAGGATKIELVGFDGFDGRDERFHKVNDVFAMLLKVAGNTPIHSLTLTHYDIPQRSIYSF